MMELSSLESLILYTGALATGVVNGLLISMLVSELFSGLLLSLLLVIPAVFAWLAVFYGVIVPWLRREDQ